MWIRYNGIKLIEEEHINKEAVYMKQKWMIIMFFLAAILFFGCTATQSNEEVWVQAEQIVFDGKDNVLNRMVYEYDGSERKYTIHHYNSKNEESGYTDVVQTKDGTRRTETHYISDNDALFVQTDYEYREDGKPLSQKNIMRDTITQERIWNWNADGTVANVMEDGVYRYTVEYDEQNRQTRSYNESYETTFTYSDHGKVLCTTYSGYTRVEYVVHKYDEQGRTIETINYELDEDRPYTDDDIVSQSTCTYDEDGHSYVVSYVSSGDPYHIHFIYKPLSEMLK